MKDGFFRVAAATPEVRVADPVFNREQICRLMEEGAEAGAGLMVFPELCLTAYTCGDLFLQAPLLQSAREELLKIIECSEGKDMLVFVGLPWEHGGKLYNVAAALSKGKLLGIVPKCHLPNYSEFYEQRHFTAGMEEPVMTEWQGGKVPMGSRLLFACREGPELLVAAEICEDVWVPCPPSIGHVLAGALLIANCSASDETVGKDSYRRDLITGQSARLMCGYVYANAGEGESTQDLVFGGHNIIAENGTMLAASKRFVPESIYADMDLDRLVSERRRTNTHPGQQQEGYLWDKLETWEDMGLVLAEKQKVWSVPWRQSIWREGRKRNCCAGSPAVPLCREMPRRGAEGVRRFLRYRRWGLKRGFSMQAAAMGCWGFPGAWIPRWLSW